MSKTLSNKNNLQVLFEDNHIIIVNKRAGDIVQGDKTGDKPLSDVVKEYIKDKYNKPGNVYLGTVHRLDRPTTGLVIFAKTSKVLPRLNKLFLSKDINKTYWALVKNEPKLLSLKRALQHFIEHRREVITRRTEYELKKARARAHILDGLVIALDNIDAVIETIRSSADVGAAKENLIKRFKLSELQAQAILDGSRFRLR